MRLNIFQHSSVAGIGDTAAFRCVDLNTEATRVRHGNGIPLFHDDRALSSVIVCIDQAVCQGFTECLMYRCIIHSCAAIHFKWHLDILDLLVIDMEIEVVHIAAPVTGGRNDPISPACIVIIPLLIVQEVRIEFPNNIILVAEYEKARGGGRLLSVCADANSAQHGEH